MTTVGIDVGSQKTVLVAENGEIVRTDTGSVSVPTLVSFVEQSRYVGDEAASFPFGPGRIPLLNLAVGEEPEKLLATEIPHKAFLEHCPAKFSLDSGEAIFSDIPYCGESISISAAALLAVLVGNHSERVRQVYGSDATLVFTVPHTAGPVTAKNYMIGRLCFNK